MNPTFERSGDQAASAAARTRIIVSITQVGEGLARQIQRAAEAGADVVELRVDLIHDLPAVRTVLQQRPPGCPPLLLTIRSAEEGGAWDGDEAVRVALIESLGLLAPDMIDVEWQTWRRSANVRQKLGLVCRRTDGVDESQGQRPKADLLLSRHDTGGTPATPELERTLDALGGEPAAVAKYVSTAHDALDGLRVLDQLRRRAATRPWIALAMGPAGLATRVLAAKLGGWGTFAASDAESAAAPGQLDVALLRSRYRIDQLARPTRVLGVIGWPVQHSRSPQLHNAALAADGIDAVYLPLPVMPTSAAFAAFMDFAAGADWLDALGFSVTIPHKEHALRWLDSRGAVVSDLARRCGAVNTLSRDPDGAWRGDNSDVTGLLAALASASTEQGGGRPALVLGAGGVARAAIVALKSAGWSVTLSNRTADRAAALAGELGVARVPWDKRGATVFDLLVNATSLGMTPVVDETPLPTEAVRERAASAGGRGPLVVADTVYTPPETRLLREARAAGAVTVSGLQMFLAQASEQYRMWHARPMPHAVLAGSLDDLP